MIMYSHAFKEINVNKIYHNIADCNYIRSEALHSLGGKVW